MVDSQWQPARSPAVMRSSGRSVVAPAAAADLAVLRARLPWLRVHSYWPSQVSATLWRSSGQARVGSGIVSTFHELGGAITVAVLASIAAPSLAAMSLSSAGFTRAFTSSAIAALAAAALAALIVPAGEALAGAMPHAR